MTDAEAAAWDAEVDATAATSTEREAAEQQPPTSPSTEDIKRIARQIQGRESETLAHIEDIAKRIRGPF